MIKTMLLTAQLALSPIVGTNGLQPKRLANPVYGETTDYSVTYDGNTYTRFFYGNFFAKFINQVDPEGNDIEVYLGYKEETDLYKVLASDDLNWTAQTNIAKLPTNYYIYWYAGDFDPNNAFTLPTGKWAINYWIEKETTLYYQEIFLTNNEDTGTFTIEKAEQWNWEKSSGEEWQTGNHLENEYPSLTQNSAFYTFCPTTQVLDFGNWERHIPEKAQETPNPSVYDNIYNFYYENLFANDALDDLNAEVGNNSLTMRQWLAHTATIVSISLLACALIILVIKIFKLIAGSLSDIWG